MKQHLHTKRELKNWHLYAGVFLASLMVTLTVINTIELHQVQTITSFFTVSR